MTTYASSTLGMTTQYAFGATVVVGLCGAICAPIAGTLSDRLGRKPVMLVPWVLLALAVFPCFALLEHQRSANRPLCCVRHPCDRLDALSSSVFSS